MPRIPHLRPQNVWSNVSVPHQGDFTTLDQALVDCWNGDDGSDLTLLADLAIGGAGMALNSAGSQIRGGFTTQRAGRAQLGNNDYDTYNPARTRSTLVLAHANLYNKSRSTFVANPYGLMSGGPDAGGVADLMYIRIPSRSMHHGATLDSVEVRFRVTVARTGVVGTYPSASIYKLTSASAATLLGGLTLTPANPDAWFNGGKPQSVVIAAIAHTVDTTSLNYLLAWSDEAGANAAASTIVHSVKLNFTGIADGHPS